MSISKIKVGSTEHDLKASQLTTARTITLSGGVSGSTTFDGSQNVTITTTVADDSHNHVISNVDGLQTTLDGKLEKNTAGGIASKNGEGNYNYLKIATIKITNNYINRPIVFEISGRGRGLSLITIEFSNVNNTDPGLSLFISNYDNCFYIKKTATSTWEIYGEYSEPWGDYTIHRITGCGANIGVTVNMTNIDSLPSGCTRITYGGYVKYATSAGSATKATQDGNGNVITSTYATKTELTNGLNGKADSSHGTHVSYSTAAPLMDGTASAGSASTVARSDHKHPTDTSRAAASDLTLHTGNTTVHITSTERTNWNAAKTHADSAHAPSNAEKNQNAFSNITVGSTTIAADSATDTLTLVAGTNVTLTPDATNDKVTITASDTKVTQTVTTSNAAYPLLLAPSGQTATQTTTSYFDSGVTLNPSTNTIVANVSGNAGTATKLATARTIGLGTGATGTATSFDGSGNITIPVTSVKEAYLSWGGENFAASYGPIDAAMVPELGANRLAFMPASAVIVEYSQNNGSTWSTYSLSDESKINLFNGNGAVVHIGASSATGINKSSYMARVTINTSAASVYTALNKFVIYCSTNGSTGSYCTVQGRLQSNYEAGTDTWTTFANKVDIAGWSGYNVINTSTITTYGNTKTAQYGQVRFTFGTTGHSNTNYPGLSIIKIFGFGGVGWTTPSTMAKTGHMYTYDYAQNVNFPAKVTATSFTENGTVLSSKYAAKNHKHSVTAAGTNSSTSITPAGTVSQPTFTGTAASHNHTFTGTAAEHNHTFTGTEKTVSVKYTPAGTVSSSFTGTAHNHTFSGTAATSGKPDTTNVTTIYSITGVGSLPSASLSSGTLPSCSYTAPSHTYTAPSLTGSVSNQCLTLTFNAGSHSFSAGSHSFSAGAFPTLTFSAGTLPTREAVSMPNTNHTHSVTATGTIGNATAGGSVSSTFTGTEATISHTFTPAGSISKASLTPAGTISSKELTPAGTVSKPTFTGTAASHTHTFTGSAVNSATES